MIIRLLLFTAIITGIAVMPLLVKAQQPSFSPAFIPDDHWVGDGKYSCCSRVLKHDLMRTITAAPVLRPYNVLSYSVLLDWVKPLRSSGETGNDRQYWGANTIRLRIDTTNVSALTFHAHLMIIDSVIIGGKRLQTPIETLSATKEIRLLLPIKPQKGDTLTLTLFYTSKTQTNNDGGFYLYRKGRFGGLRTQRDSDFVAERLAYTMSEPNDARIWLPCNDTPTDKALLDMTIRVPLGFTAVSNGLLERIDTNRTTETTTFVWRHQRPIPTYLMVAVASVYKQQQLWHKRYTNPNDSLPVHNYFWAADDTSRTTNNIQYSASITLGSISSILTSFSRWYGEYPFEGYGTAVIQPFQFGGMEHQTMMTINRSWLRNNLTGVAHEIMHHWTGDYVTCGTWADIWMNEGGATHGEALWYESWGGLPWYKDAMKNFRERYLTGRNNMNPLYVTAGDDIATLFNYATTYAKAAWVYHMLRRITAVSFGDSTYFSAMRRYLSDYAYTNATTEQFRASIEKALPGTTPIPLKTFFDQWVYRSGHPKYDLSWSVLTKGNDYAVTTTLYQTQTGAEVPDVFHMPVTLSFIGANGQRAEHTMINTKRQQTETYTLGFKPLSVIVDDAESILCERTPRAALSRSPDSLSTTANPLLFPAPLRSGEVGTLSLHSTTSELFNIALIDILGRTIKPIFEGILEKGSYYLPVQTDGLAQGVYFIKVQREAEAEIFKFAVIR